MANPAQADSQADEGLDDEGTDNKPVTIEAKINSVVDNMTRDEKGQYVLPDDLNEAEKFAAIAEKRRRDTQSGYTKTAQENKALKAEKATLLKKVSSAVMVELTPAQAEELDELKFSDPEAWRRKVNAYENAAATKQQRALDEELSQVTASSLATEELEQRAEVLAAFNQAHPDVEFTDDMIANDIPPRIVKKLETGKISFEAFLQEAYDYTKSGKIVKQVDNPPNKQPNLSKVGGGHKPDDNAIKEDIVLSYNKEIY